MTTTQSGFFGPPEAPLFGTLHRVADAAPVWGAVLCAPLGQEMMNCYRTQQALAEALVARGLPCLRFDLAGCGNSADRLEDAARGALPAWQASLDAAIEHLRAATGVTHVAVIAMRAGALLAAPVAARRPEVRAFVAISPVIAGRNLLREWRALAATASLREAHDDGSLEAAGEAYSAPTLDALGSLALAELAWPATRPVLLIDREDLPSTARWQARLQADGVPVTSVLRGGIADMLLEPHRQVVPQALVAEVADWLQSLARPTGRETPASYPPAASMLRTSPEPDALVATGVRERVLSLPADGTPLFGVLAEPEAAGRGGAVLLLPNTGGVHHVGGHRLYVMLARRLAAQGHRVIRFDLSGLGESPARPGEPADVVYGRRAVDDLVAAVAAARARWPETTPTVLGLCAGGYHALRLAVRQAAVSQCVVVNPLVYHWHEGMTLEAQEPLVQAAYYRAKWRSRDSWVRLVSGKSDLRQLVRVASGRLARVVRDAWTRLLVGGSPAVRDDLNRDLLTAAAQGVKLQFIFSAGEPGWSVLQAEAGRVIVRLQRTGQVRVHHLDRADHTLTTASARERFMLLVSQLLAHSLERGPAESTAAVGAVEVRAATTQVLEH